LIKSYCIKNKFIFINEDVISPYTTEEIIKKGIPPNRAGWIKQQLIKLNLDSLEFALEKFLVIDADTILLRDQFFSFLDLDVLKHSDEFHLLYKKSNRFLLGRYFFTHKSYISHHQLFRKSFLKELKENISYRHKMTWYDTFILSALNNYNFVSEYELYAQYCIQNKTQFVLTQYWFNKNKKYQSINKFKINDNRALSISYHNYIAI
jgi:hypothetical protein